MTFENLAALQIEQFIIPLITIVGSAIVSAAMLFVGRLLSRGDSIQDGQRKDIRDINKAIGLLESAKEKAHDADQRHERRIERLEDEVRSLRERTLVLEKFNDGCEDSE